jgi:hypothetical protein
MIGKERQWTVETISARQKTMAKLAANAAS